MIKTPTWRSKGEILLFLFCSLSISALLSCILGKDISWDVANYHYYNAFAFLHHRSTIDYWPSSYIHMYFNPIADLLSYLLIQYLSPLKVQLILGMLNGINIWLIYLILNYFIPQQLPYRIPISFAFLTVCFTSPFGLISLGDLRNDYLCTSFVLGFVLCQLKFLTNYINNKKMIHPTIILGGLSLGIAVGLKLTNGLFFIATILSAFFLPLPFKDRFKWIILIGVSTVFGILIASGYWMFHLWEIYHNPIFPFFNHLFQINQFSHAPINTYAPYLPQGWLENIILPFSMAIYGTPIDHAGIFHEFRFALVAILLLLNIIFYWHWRRIKKNLLFYWLCLFFIFSFIVWQYNFAVSRYILPLTLLAPLLIYLLTLNFITYAYARIILLIIFSYVLLGTTTFPEMIRLSKYKGTYFNINLPEKIMSIPKAYVLVAYPAYAISNVPKPQTYLIPAFPAEWHFIGIPFENSNKTLFEDHILTNIKTLLASINDSIYLLTSAESLPTFYEAVKPFGLTQAGTCLTITSDRQWISNSQTVLCPVKKGV